MASLAMGPTRGVSLVRLRDFGESHKHAQRFEHREEPEEAHERREGHEGVERSLCHRADTVARANRLCLLRADALPLDHEQRQAILAVCGYDADHLEALARPRGITSPGLKSPRAKAKGPSSSPSTVTSANRCMRASVDERSFPFNRPLGPPQTDALTPKRGRRRWRNRTLPISSSGSVLSPTRSHLQAKKGPRKRFPAPSTAAGRAASTTYS